MAKVSVVINALNEEKNIRRAIASVGDFADEIVVVDMHSDDKTVEIAKSLGSKVYQHDRTGYVEPARNFAIEKAAGDWILILDSDEEVSSDLKVSLKKLVGNPKADYYRIPRKNLIFGKWMKNSRFWPDYNIRFFKKGTVVWSEIIHSVPTTTGVGADLPAAEENALVHYHYETVEQYIDKLNRYTTFQAQLLAKGKYKFDWKDVVTNPCHEFLSRYFDGHGYKDGVHGLALALLQAFSELVVYLKAWQKEKFESETLTVDEFVSQSNALQKEFNFWKADALLSNGGGIVQRLKRKFRLS